MKTVVEAIDLSLLEQHKIKEKPRGHLGMSRIGHDDARTLWYEFRWSLPNDFTARTLRIFQAGHDGEEVVVKLLKQAGYQVWEVNQATGRQWRVGFLGGHFAGSSDGIIKGVPGFEELPHLLEIKTAKASKFREFQKQGVSRANPVYWYQMQSYMAKEAMNLEAALFVVMCKDDSKLYIERVTRQDGIFDRLYQKAGQLITSDAPPRSTYKDRTWYECKWRSEHWNDIYWGNRLPTPNCRNCKHASAVTEGNGARWYCKQYACNLDIDLQRVGCGSHLYLPALMPADLVAYHAEHNVCEYTTREEQTARFFNGNVSSTQQVFNSWELEQISKVGITVAQVADPLMGELRAEFDGRVVHYASNDDEQPRF